LEVLFWFLEISLSAWKDGIELELKKTRIILKIFKSQAQTVFQSLDYEFTPKPFHV